MICLSGNNFTKKTSNLFSGGHERQVNGKEVYHSSAMSLMLEHGRPIVAYNLKFLKYARAGAASVFFQG
jgi:hypothetical protein